jgi:hypothetical protein
MFSSPVRSLAWLTASLTALATAIAVTSARGATAAPTDTALAAPTARDRDENPRVRPGLVNWHPTFADARAAAEKSGRPVLVFHMMGQLDRQFC